MNSKIKELFKDEKCVYCFDVDGVLVPMEFGEYNHYVFDDEKWEEELHNNDFYQNVRPNKIIQKFLENKDMSRVYVITRAIDEVELNQKRNFAFKYYGIVPNNVYIVYSDDEKLNVMKEIHKFYNGLEDKYMVMIDDTVNVLNNIMDNSSYSTVHVSSFF